MPSMALRRPWAATSSPPNPSSAGAGTEFSHVGVQRAAGVETGSWGGREGPSRGATPPQLTLGTMARRGVQGLETVDPRVEKSWWNLSNLLTQYMIHVFPLTHSDSCVSPSSHPCFVSLPAPQRPLPPLPGHIQLQTLPFLGAKVRACVRTCV